MASFNAITSVTSGLPFVIVPVLSKAIAFTSLRVCIASPFLIKIPRSAPLPLPTIKAVGVPKPNAQGQEMTSTAVAVIKANVSGFASGLTHGRKVEAHSIIPK